MTFVALRWWRGVREGGVVVRLASKMLFLFLEIGQRSGKFKISTIVMICGGISTRKATRFAAGIIEFGRNRRRRAVDERLKKQNEARMSLSQSD